jgi:hypothetical protein
MNCQKSNSTFSFANFDDGLRHNGAPPRSLKRGNPTL